MCDGNGSYLTTKNRKQQEPFRESNNDISQTQKMRWKTETISSFDEIGKA